MCFVFSSLIKGQILQDGGLGTTSVSARMMFMYLYFTVLDNLGTQNGIERGIFI